MISKAQGYMFFKLLTFVPILVIIFYTDFGVWAKDLITGANMPLGFLVAAIALFSYGVFLKRKIILGYLEFSRANIPLGFIALVASGLMYLVGSLFIEKSVFHFESLIILLIAYLLLRFDVRLIRVMLPLFVILGISFSVTVFSSIIGTLGGGVYTAILITGFFSIYVAVKPRPILLAGLLVMLSLVSWLIPISYVLKIVPILLIPVYLITFLFPSFLRQRFVLPVSVTAVCKHDVLDTHDFPGFCVNCGRKIGPSGKLSPSFLGLVLIVAMIFVLLTVQVPVVTITGGVPQASVYKYSGVATSNILGTPAGWLMNSSSVLKLEGDVSALSMVYVPSFHPERENYTLVYAVSSQVPNIGTGTSGQIPGWTLKSVSLTSLGALSGYEKVYQSQNKLLLFFSATTNRLFMNGSSFIVLNIGLSYSRIFTNVPASNASTTFMNDLSNIFLPSLGASDYYDSWTIFLHGASIATHSLYAIGLTLGVGGLIFWGVYAVGNYESRNDAEITGASDIDEKDWRLFQRICMSMRRESTTYEIADENDESSVDLNEMSSQLKGLESHGVITHVLSERGSELMLAWRAVV